MVCKLPAIILQFRAEFYEVCSSMEEGMEICNKLNILFTKHFVKMVWTPSYNGR